MSSTVIILVGALCAIAVAIVIALLCPPPRGEEAVTVSGADISLKTQGSIVTVRKVGRITSVSISHGIHDHWEGSDGVQVPLLPPDVARTHEPVLFNEYMSPQTSAIRKYEIIDELYAMGYTLPYIKGLNELYKKEMKEALSDGGPDARTIHERTPVNLKKLSPDRSLMETEFPPMDEPEENDNQ